jgi:cob(I)alamin adenosyltransferase
MISVYTKTGDKGESGLANGQRLAKSDPIFEVLGTLDELNSHLGLCVVKLSQMSSSRRMRSVSASEIQLLLDIQDTLFHVGAEVAGSTKTSLQAKKIVDLEKEIDHTQTLMGDNWYQKFVLPGGCESAAQLDVARAVCRRCERLLVSYSEHHTIRQELLQYLNRLSDYLYVLRCFENLNSGKQENVFDIHHPVIPAKVGIQSKKKKQK